ncbi:HD domain-containing protein [Cronobacter dublinensis]|uniref:HD domain-containing protein n=1 Tax=Cronobacter dublinensis TaxID=413497 RepID=UPI001319EE8E|nr:hypothetical protein [Cronobacter dublinensis]
MRIEQRLKKLADENPNYSLLWAQWEFDKKLLSRALNTVSRDFPHYSLHDASHSSTIITQIEKVIAPNIELLSATDCWLLLESCYWHDAGMIVSYEDKQKLLSQQHFRSYLKELESSDHELSTHAKMIMSEVSGNDPSHALLISNSLTFIISDYFRREHAERSGRYVTEPSQIKIDSPRTILIPNRLFRFIAQIVQCHGRDREEILSLPKINDGMDITDYAHPRYIAALLRIGDLLDIDDGRFCPTLLANIGQVPQSSIDHQHKHASINDILINSDVIEINAECDHYGGYYAQQNWFDYIQSEFDFQKRIWDRIVPDNSYKSLPTIKALNCEIKGYITLDRKVPKITLDEKRVYSYLTGSHLYSEQLPFLREVVQNAIDATYYKVWEDVLFNPNFLTLSEHKQKITFEESLAKESINIKLKEVINSDLMPGVTNDKKSILYELFIKDCGDGMAENDIKKCLRWGQELQLNEKPF